jgi:hypothetical protein
MNAALPIVEAMPAATPYSATRYEAYRIVEPGGGWRDAPPPRTTYALGEIPGATLDEALNATLTKCLLMHKDHLAIRETSERGSRVHLYSIKRKSQPDYRTEGHRVVRTHQLYAAFVCTMDGAVFG